MVQINVRQRLFENSCLINELLAAVIKASIQLQEIFLLRVFRKHRLFPAVLEDLFRRHSKKPGKSTYGGRSRGTLPTFIHSIATS